MIHNTGDSVSALSDPVSGIFLSYNKTKRDGSFLLQQQQKHIRQQTTFYRCLIRKRNTVYCIIMIKNRYRRKSDQIGDGIRSEQNIRVILLINRSVQLFLFL